MRAALPSVPELCRPRRLMQDPMMLPDLLPPDPPLAGGASPWRGGSLVCGVPARAQPLPAAGAAGRASDQAGKAVQTAAGRRHGCSSRRVFRLRAQAGSCGCGEELHWGHQEAVPQLRAREAMLSHCWYRIPAALPTRISRSVLPPGCLDRLPAAMLTNTLAILTNRSLPPPTEPFRRLRAAAGALGAGAGRHTVQTHYFITSAPV